MSKLYSENTTIVWNGNLVNGGSAKVTEFFNNLPATEHKLSSLDCQPVTGNENEVGVGITWNFHVISSHPSYGGTLNFTSSEK